MMENDCPKGYLDAALTEGAWQGWYLAEGGRIVRLSRSRMAMSSPGKVPVDFRMYFVSSGAMDCSGICYGRMQGTVRDLHRDVADICEIPGVGMKMCGLEGGALQDSLECAYLRHDGKELARASMFITGRSAACE